MRPYQKRTHSPQIVAPLLLSEAVMGSACGSIWTKRNTTAPRMRSFGGHFTRGQHQVEEWLSRDTLQ